MKLEIEIKKTPKQIPEHGTVVLFQSAKRRFPRIGTFINNGERTPHFLAESIPFWLDDVEFLWCELPDLTK